MLTPSLAPMQQLLSDNGGPREAASGFPWNFAWVVGTERGQCPISLGALCGSVPSPREEPALAEQALRTGWGQEGNTVCFLLLSRVGLGGWVASALPTLSCGHISSGLKAWSEQGRAPLLPRRSRGPGERPCAQEEDSPHSLHRWWWLWAPRPLGDSGPPSVERGHGRVLVGAVSGWSGLISPGRHAGSPCPMPVWVVVGPGPVGRAGQRLVGQRVSQESG